ncbi:MAG: acetylornithine deacetylase [Propioniciclava sp.]|uniref:acetylornithine deacetylase n=1 Tax=Propioniciclava sp. TaxID=2038686 RepID=UPI0039E45E3C
MPRSRGRRRPDAMVNPSPAVLDWLAQLVALDTTSRDSNRPLIDLVAAHARGLGLTTHLFPAPDGRKANLLVTVPDADGNTTGGVMLSGHSDVVPTDGQPWTSDPYRLTERDGLLYGRGTTDMKGFVAVVVAALDRLAATPLAEPVHLALTYDEEVGCLAAEPLVESLASIGVAPRVCFVGEPTSMRMIRGHKSINLMDVHLHGVAAHSSLPTLGVNTIHHAADLISYWRDRCAAWRDGGPFDEAYPVAYTTGAVTMVTGGNGVNIVPAQCTLTLEFRSIGTPEQDAAEVEALRARCREVEAAMQAEDACARVELTVRAQTVGLDTGEDAAVVALGRELGLAVEPEKVTYATEAGVYARAGISTVVCGPGDIAQAHKPDEFVDPDQLAQCEVFISRLIDRLTRPGA